MIDWNVLYKISLGLYVLAAKDNDRPVGCIVDAVMVAANKPCALAISCNNASFTKQCIEKNKNFVLSVLPKDIAPEVIANFGFRSSKNTNKWDLVKSSDFAGLPVLDNAIAYISARVVHQYAMDSNTIFIAEITDTKHNREVEPLLYQDYRGEFKDKVLQSFKNINEEKKMAKQWVCTVCNYVYDGDVPFEKLDDEDILKNIEENDTEEIKEQKLSVEELASCVMHSGRYIPAYPVFYTEAPFVRSSCRKRKRVHRL